jgi:hypothetical protein
MGSFFGGRVFRILASLAIACALWVAVKLSQTYRLEVQVPVAYQNLPLTLKLARPLPRSLTAQVSGVGHQLLFPYFNPGRDSLRLPLSGVLTQGYLEPARLRAELQEFLPSALRLEQFEPDTIALAFEEKVEKRVPVVSRMLLEPQAGYFLTERVLFAPDSVTLLGTRKELSGVDAWPTVLQSREGLTGPMLIDVALQPSAEIVVLPPTVGARVEVERFTEGTAQVRVRLLGQGVGEQARLLPQEVTVRYLVPFRLFEQVSEEDFEVSVDLRQAHPWDVPSSEVRGWSRGCSGTSSAGGNEARPDPARHHRRDWCRQKLCVCGVSAAARARI